MFNLICWTYGYRMMSGQGKLSLKTALLNPGMIGLIFGLPIYFLKIPVPAVVAEPINFFSGPQHAAGDDCDRGYIARVDIRSFVSDVSVYKMAALRLLAAPAVFFLFLLLIRPEPDLFISSAIQASCPVAANTVLFAVQYHCDSNWLLRPLRSLPCFPYLLYRCLRYWPRWPVPCWGLPCDADREIAAEREPAGWKPALLFLGKEPFR